MAGPRGVHRQRLPPSRRVMMAALAAGRKRVPVHGLIEVDLTDVRPRLTEADLSLTAFAAASIGRAAARHPEVHRYRDWLGRMVTRDTVDLSVIVEVPLGDGRFPLATLIENADRQSVAQISETIRNVKEDPGASPSTRRAQRFVPVLGRIPGLMHLVFWFVDRTELGRRNTGTISLSAVGMFGDGGGHGIIPLTSLTVAVLMGGVSDKPKVVDGEIVVREVLDLSVAADHMLVDGGPVTRFIADLKETIESAEVLAAP